MKNSLKNTLFVAFVCISLFSFSNNSAHAATLKTAVDPIDMPQFFRMMDKDGNGFISLREWQIGGFQDYEDKFYALERNGDGQLDYIEFLLLD
jgi:hypothetical protein